MNAPRGGGRGVTPWFDPEILPVRGGAYECEYCGNGITHTWAGSKWMWGKSEMTKFTPFRWRGLTKEQKK